MGEFGILLSTGVCAAMFSFRWTDNWLRRLLDRPRAFVTLASVALVIDFVPHLYTLAITIAYLLLAALFYPSVRVMSECKDTGTLSKRYLVPYWQTGRYSNISRRKGMNAKHAPKRTVTCWTNHWQVSFLRF